MRNKKKTKYTARTQFICEEDYTDHLEIDSDGEEYDPDWYPRKSYEITCDKLEKFNPFGVNSGDIVEFTCDHPETCPNFSGLHVDKILWFLDRDIYRKRFARVASKISQKKPYEMSRIYDYVYMDYNDDYYFQFSDRRSTIKEKRKRYFHTGNPKYLLDFVDHKKTVRTIFPEFNINPTGFHITDLNIIYDN